jgi:hypothetical protein
LRGVVIAALTALLVSLIPATGFAAPPTPSPAPISAIGLSTVSWIAASPAYDKTGTVVVVAAQITQCRTSRCANLWVSRDKGVSWKQAKASGWDGSHPAIAVEGSRQEILFDQGSSGLLRSDDLGETWAKVGAPGNLTLTPSYSKDHTVAVAGPADYVLQNGATHPVAGSGGGFSDLGFAFSPSFPRSGAHSPALLVVLDRATGQPLIERCNADLSCSNPVSLPGSQGFSLPVNLSVSADFARDGVVFAQTGRGVYKSTDGGATFKLLDIAKSATANATSTPMMAMAEGYKEAGPVRTAYVAVYQTFGGGVHSHSEGGIYKTTDGGASWERIGSPSLLDEGATAVGAAPGGRLFAGFLTKGALSGLLCSPNEKVWTVDCSTRGPQSGPSRILGLPLRVVVAIVVFVVLSAIVILRARRREAERPPNLSLSGSARVGEDDGL